VKERRGKFLKESSKVGKAFLISVSGITKKREPEGKREGPCKRWEKIYATGLTQIMKD